MRFGSLRRLIELLTHPILDFSALRNTVQGIYHVRMKSATSMPY